MSDTRVGRTPRSDAEWARETERRLRALERARTARAGEYVLSSRDGRLVATKPGETPLEVGQVPAPVEIDLSARGSVVSDITAIATAVGYPEVDEEDPPSLDDVRQWVLQQLFGKIPPSRIPGLPWAHLFDGAEELLDDPSFDNPSTFANNTAITYDPDFGRLKPGSARIDADGTTKTAVSNLISVATGEVMPMSVHVFYEGVTATGPDPIQMVVRGYHVEEDGTRTLVDTTVIDAVAAPSGESDDVPGADDGWLRLAGSYTVPEPTTSVDEIVMEISVTADLTAGTVWFDDGSVTKTRDGMPQSWILNLPTDLNSLWNGLGSLVDQILTRLGITPVGSLLDRIFDLSDELEWIQEKAQEGALGAAQAIQDVAGLAQSLLTDPASVIGTIGQDMVAGLQGALSGLSSDINGVVGGIAEAIFSGWRGTTAGSSGTTADIQQTIEIIHKAVYGDYTIETITSNQIWNRPFDPDDCLEFWAICVGGGGRGMPGQTIRPPTETSELAYGGAGGRSGGYNATRLDPQDIPAAVECTVGAAAASNGSDGGITSFGSLAQSTPGVGSISHGVGYLGSASKPGDGGQGGDAYMSRPGSGVNAAVGYAGRRGESSALGAGGSGGNSGGGDGGPGSAASLVGPQKSGGGGGGGGGGQARSSGTATGGNGGNGGYPGGGSGGGGAAAGVSGVTGGATPGQPGIPANGVLFLAYKLEEG